MPGGWGRGSGSFVAGNSLSVIYIQLNFRFAVRALAFMRNYAWWIVTAFGRVPISLFKHSNIWDPWLQ